MCTAAPPKREDEPAAPEARDPRIWPLSATMMLSGTAVGVVLPVMPLLVGQLGLSEAQFGIAGDDGERAHLLRERRQQGL